MFCFCLNNELKDQLSIIYKDIKIIPVDVDETKSTYDKCKLIGLELEKIILNKNLLFNVEPLPLVMLIFENCDLNKLTEKMTDLRNDEISFFYKNVGQIQMILGSSRAFIKWSSSYINIEKMKEKYPFDYIRSTRNDHTDERIWWAWRIGLKPKQYINIL